MNKSVLAVIALAVILVLGLVFPRTGFDADKAEAILKEAAERLGALVGPEVPSEFFSINGVQRHYRYNNSLSQSTTTPCVLTSPNATSTLVSGLFQMTVASDTPVLNVRMFRTAANTFSTTSGTALTSLFAWTNTGTANDDINPSIQASTTPGAATVFTPKQNLVVGVNAKNVDSGGEISLTGSCSATFEVFKSK